MSDSVRPHRRQPTRLPRPWDSPGKNTGVGCQFLLQRMKVKSESEVAQSCLTLCDPMNCSLPGPSVHGILQARVYYILASFVFYILISPLVIQVLIYEIIRLISEKAMTTLSDPMDCSLSGSSVHGIFQARVLEWVGCSPC